MSPLAPIGPQMAPSQEARHGFLALVDRIGARGQQHGFRYELEVAAFFARLPSTQVVRLSQRIPYAGSAFSDIDVVVDGVAYQAKVNTNAIRREGGLEQSVLTYAERVRDAGFDELVYVSPLRDSQNNLGFTSNTIARVQGWQAMGRMPNGLEVRIGSQGNVPFIPFK